MQVSDEQTAALEAKGITKRFGNTVALRAVDARLDAGRCLGLVGRNGAGKSTLVSILSGLVAPDEGLVTFDGQPAPRISDVASWKSRISTVYQRSMVVPWLTVAENVFLGAQPTRSGLLDWGEMRDRTAAVMQEWGFDIDPSTSSRSSRSRGRLPPAPAAWCSTSPRQRSSAPASRRCLTGCAS
jgi:simple sugar transport system ATP-binding protein